MHKNEIICNAFLGIFQKKHKKEINIMHNVSLGERLKLLRGDKTQACFAELVGININTLRGYESGNRLPAADTILDLCIKTNVSPEWLIMGSGPIFKGTTSTPSDNADSERMGDASPILKTQHPKNTRLQNKEISDCRPFEPSGVEKTADMSAIKKKQHIEIIKQEKKEMADRQSAGQEGINSLQRELREQDKELRDLMRENSTILRENGDLRVDVERKKARIVELERELARVLKGEEAFPLAGAG